MSELPVRIQYRPARFVFSVASPISESILPPIKRDPQNAGLDDGIENHRRQDWLSCEFQYTFTFNSRRRAIHPQRSILSPLNDYLRRSYFAGHWYAINVSFPFATKAPKNSYLTASVQLGRLLFQKGDPNESAKRIMI